MNPDDTAEITTRCATCGEPYLLRVTRDDLQHWHDAAHRELLIGDTCRDCRSVIFGAEAA